MKNSVKYFGIVLLVLFGFQVQAQQRDLDNFRPLDQRGIHMFEAPKDTISTFDGVRVRVGGASTIQFQSLSHQTTGQWTDADGNPQGLAEIGSNFNLPTANLDLDVQLFSGVRMHLRTYLSSRHHPEPYVKDGYIQIDALDFIAPGFMQDVMNHVTVKIGHMENNYGDAHFRRTDNAQAIYNPFVGNLIMDSFTTEVGAEIYYRHSGFLLMGGATNGKLNQSVTNPSAAGVSWLGKVGYDNFDFASPDDLRFRLTGSVYHTSQVPTTYLYSADRAGSRYYEVMELPGVHGFRSGRYNPNFGNEMTAFMINPFVKFGGLEFFGTYEIASGKRSNETSDRSFTQMSGELIYRFGMDENFYVGGRYNTVNGDDPSGVEIDINRVQVSAGWFMTKNILTKIEYVNQQYDGFRPNSRFHGGQFDGIMVEAAISF
ncbi:hypothetical protein FHG64_12080 [Antarcticibacterium flavum]|uniref:Porin n=1 Tax=Antarcticibacterium flavum TaxID=2058175 RepID=A0A5B7X428_9FLAO|nr:MULTISPECIES: hypothetical protein [Antarcticibacterium]MCM4158313.1 hypothetical protein [Antarcticibacterium sp. W02-3]QCY70079.1 hypothetical protein FHG64_12080 [Antarcticibacterium flavum]